MKNNKAYTQQNRRAWNEIAETRERTFPPAAFFSQGGSTLDQRAVDAVKTIFGEIQGLRLIHLQCATGEDTLSWAVLGARCVGVDISDQQIELARRKSVDAGLQVDFAAADVYDLPDALSGHTDTEANFDVAFTGGGALVWLPDLTSWAKVISSLLRPGGRLVLIDEHPLSSCLWVENGQLEITSDYFGRSTPEEGTGWYHFKGGETARENKFEFTWPLGDIITAVAQAGLVIEQLIEYPGGPEWRFGKELKQVGRLPGEFILIAKKV